jgi:ectoine hydroxylase-related dioxygenase (phytanoyl-CoA dioxygenase family)
MLDSQRESVQPTTDLGQAKRDLDNSGFCLIPSVLGGEELAAARDRLVAQAVAEERAGLDFRDSGKDQGLLDDYGQIKADAFSKANGGVNQRLWMLMNKGQCFRDMVVHPMVDELIGHILGPRFLLSTHSANIAKPGGKRMGLHTDQWWMPQPEKPGSGDVRPSEITRLPAESALSPDPTLGIAPAVVANTMWMLSDFTVENGATEVVAGSHLTGAQPHPTDQADYPIEQMVGAAGSLAVFDGRLWHGTGAHVGGQDRLGVLGTFCAPQFRQQENQILGLDRSLWPTLSDKMKERLGFKPWNAYGRVESPAAPWVELEPERISELS